MKNGKQERLVVALVCVNVALVVLVMLAVAVAVGCYLGMAAGWATAAAELMVLLLMSSALLHWAVRLGRQDDGTSS